MNLPSMLTIASLPVLRKCLHIRFPPLTLPSPKGRGFQKWRCVLPFTLWEKGWDEGRRIFRHSLSITLLFLFAVLIIAHTLPMYAEERIASGRAAHPASLSYDTELLKTIKKPQTVVDYFLLLPEAYFTHYGATTSSVKSFGTKTRRTILSSFSSDTSKMLGVELFTGALEIKNKYLIINTPESSAGYSFSVALWTLKNKKTLVGFCRRRWQREGAGTEVAFLTFENNKWQDVTTQVFPDIPLTTFFSWSGLKKHPHLKAPLDIELARGEQAIIVHLDMLTLQQMPELKPIGAGLEKSVTTRTLELRLNNDAFAIMNKY